jgi:hypothetical protein
MCLKILQQLETSFIEFDSVSGNNELNWIVCYHNVLVTEHILNHLNAHGHVVSVLDHLDEARLGVSQVVWFVVNIILHDPFIHSLEVFQVRFELRF